MHRRSLPAIHWLAVVVLAVACLFGAPVLIPSASAANAPTCAVCGKRVSGKYMVADGKAYCSEKCFNTTLPTCDVCGKVLIGRFLSSGGHRYCSDACYQTTLPTCTICHKPAVGGAQIAGQYYCAEHARGPRCSVCGLPFAEGGKLPDGRLLCQTCAATAVVEPAAAQKVYEQARQDVATLTGLKSPTLPTMKLVGIDVLGEMMQKTAHIELGANMVQRGLYVREELTETTVGHWSTDEKVTVNETIYLLTALPPAALRLTAAHELTHDLISENFPKVKDAPLWFEEGICQYVAALLARRIGDKDGLAGIANSPDAVYGGGYRYIVKQVGESDWPKLKQWMDTLDAARLPATP